MLKRDNGRCVISGVAIKISENTFGVPAQAGSEGPRNYLSQMVDC